MTAPTRLLLSHLDRMTDCTGLIQHAIYGIPRRESGYTTDDNARAFILCNLLEEPKLLEHLATGYLAFLAAALNYRTGRFCNFMSHGRQWLQSNVR